MHKRDLIKPDGREMTLYARRSIPRHIEAPAPSSRAAPDPVHPKDEKRRGLLEDLIAVAHD